jgi:hypothetical protein
MHLMSDIQLEFEIDGSDTDGVPLSVTAAGSFNVDKWGQISLIAFGKMDDARGFTRVCEIEPGDDGFDWWSSQIKRNCAGQILEAMFDAQGSRRATDADQRNRAVA